MSEVDKNRIDGLKTVQLVIIRHSKMNPALLAERGIARNTELDDFNRLTLNSKDDQKNFDTALKNFDASLEENLGNLPKEIRAEFISVRELGKELSKQIKAKKQEIEKNSTNAQLKQELENLQKQAQKEVLHRLDLDALEKVAQLNLARLKAAGIDLKDATFVPFAFEGLERGPQADKERAQRNLLTVGALVSFLEKTIEKFITVTQIDQLKGIVRDSQGKIVISAAHQEFPILINELLRLSKQNPVYATTKGHNSKIDFGVFSDLLKGDGIVIEALANEKGEIVAVQLAKTIDSYLKEKNSDSELIYNQNHPLSKVLLHKAGKLYRKLTNQK